MARRERGRHPGARRGSTRSPPAWPRSRARPSGATAFETILVADACTDDTEAVARAAAAAAWPGPHRSARPGRGLGAGAAPGDGRGGGPADELGRSDGLIATTDADSTPAPDWLARQLAHLARGRRGGRRPDRAVSRRRRGACPERCAGGASAMPACACRRSPSRPAGGASPFRRRVAGRDRRDLPARRRAGRMRGAGGRRRSAPSWRATASRWCAPPTCGCGPRRGTDGRARRGLSVDLAVSTWREQRRYRAADVHPGRPARRQADDDGVGGAARQGVRRDDRGGPRRRRSRPQREAGLVDEVIVVDAASRDGTAARAAALGAVVLQQDELLPEHGPALGKGDAMWRALQSLPRRRHLLPGRRHRGSPPPPSARPARPAAAPSRRWRWSRGRSSVRSAPGARPGP